MIYKVQKGKLNGNYKDILDTENKGFAWACYFKTTLEPGEKKRITRDGKKLKQASRYWTTGYGER